MASELSPWRAFLRRHQRRVILGYLALVGLGLAVMALPPTRRRLLTGLEQGVRWWDARWMRRLDQGAALLAEGSVDAAVDYLSRLDAIHPATNVRHARDKERERLLRLLATGYERQGRNGRAIETYQRLVAFDSLNYRNHLELARAAERLLSGWALAPEARDAYQRALTLFPAHLPSVRGAIDYFMDRGEFIPVVTIFRSYLDAHLVQYVGVSLDDRRHEVGMLVDGVARDYELTLAGQGALRIDTGGLPFQIDRIELIPAARVGVPDVIAPVAVAGSAGFGVEPLAGGRFTPTDSVSGVRVQAPANFAVQRVRIRMALFKPVEAAPGAGGTKTNRNLLDHAGLEAAARRVIPVADARAADQMLGRLRWAREGLGVRADDFVF
jgi:tetratricopeptide (TPR) repeat protein